MAQIREGRPQRRPVGRLPSAGQSLVELALILPVLLLILVVAVDLGRIYLGWVTLNNVARVGANFAAANPSAWQGTGDAALQAQYRQLMLNEARGIDCTLLNTLPAPAFPDAAPNTYVVGSRVTVTLPCDFHLLTPVLDLLIGDGSGNVPVTATTTFSIRVSWAGTEPIGGGNPTPSPGPTPTVTPTPTSPPTPLPSGSPGPSPGPTPTPPIVTFYGTPSGVDSYGGGPPLSPPDPNEGQIVGIPNLSVTFSNTTPGGHGNCLWAFGDGAISNSCGNSVSHTYTTRNTYDVSLTIDGGTLTQSAYVLIGCKVPAFAGVHKNSATGDWTDPNSSAGGGFAAANISFAPGNGNYIIGTQSLAGGLVNPSGGCSGATITVGP